ncbi:MAG: hypothetical protein IJJ94_06100 [Bacteroidaceae bacterium]|nr:hypothetical protein [Bacteroidaceae bacterium]
MKKNLYITPQTTIMQLEGNQMLCASPFTDNGDGTISVGLSDGEGDFGDNDVINVKGRNYDVWSTSWDF